MTGNECGQPSQGWRIAPNTCPREEGGWVNCPDLIQPGFSSIWEKPDAARCSSEELDDRDDVASAFPTHFAIDARKFPRTPCVKLGMGGCATQVL